MYLLFNTIEEAINRADTEGQHLGYSYWLDGKGTRWLTEPEETIDGKWALDVSMYELSDSESNNTVDTLTLKPKPEDYDEL